MATTAKRKASPKAKRPSRPAPEPSVSKPFLRFYHSASLRKKTLSVLDALEKAEDATAHRGALGELVVELTNAGMDFYFMEPLRLSKAGFIVQQSANLGMAGAEQVMGTVIRNIIGRMDGDQLLSVSGSIRRLML